MLQLGYQCIMIVRQAQMRLYLIICCFSLVLKMASNPYLTFSWLTRQSFRYGEIRTGYEVMEYLGHLEIFLLEWWCCHCLTQS